MSVTAWDSDEAVANAGFVLAPEGRYVDPEHGIDWAVIIWRCETCENRRCDACKNRRAAPGPGQPPHCVLHGPMTPVRSDEDAS
ncbi:MAG TPA: hypothetical protein VFV01_17070 [Spirillospora sp.]|nr:hypothetical protein [Spirillospora sp.]